MGDRIHMNRLFAIKITDDALWAKYQESSIGFENLAHLQSIEKRCNGKMRLGTITHFYRIRQKGGSGRPPPPPFI